MIAGTGQCAVLLLGLFDNDSLLLACSDVSKAVETLWLPWVLRHRECANL